MTALPRREKGERLNKDKASASAQRFWNILHAAVLAALAAGAVYLRAGYDLVLLVLFTATAVSLGSFFRFSGDRRAGYAMALRLLLGVLCLTFLVWLTTLGDFHNWLVYLPVSLGLILLRRRQVLRFGRNVVRYQCLALRTSPAGLLLFYLGLALLFVYASYPIHQYDAIAKHIAIPAKILGNTHYDYNVIESVVFGDFALLVHMSSLYMLALGGTKAVVYVMVLLSATALLVPMRLFRARHGSGPWGAFAYLLLFTLTPVTLELSSMLYTDMASVSFAVLAAIYVVDSPAAKTGRNLPALFALLGGAYFSKPTAIYMALPVMVWALGAALASAWRGRLGWRAPALGAPLGVALFALPWLPAALIIWHKTGNPIFPFANGYFQSPYFDAYNFKDPFSTPLGMDFGSLWSMAFHTDKHIELPRFGLGVHALVVPVAIAAAALRRNKTALVLALLCVGGYFMSTRVTYNARYFLSAQVLSMALVAHFTGWLAGCAKRGLWRTVIGGGAGLVLAAPCAAAVFVLPYWSYAQFNPDMLRPHSELTRSPIDEIYEKIQDNHARILLNSPNPYRSAYPGLLCSISWHCSYLLTGLSEGRLSEPGLLAGFDYLVVDNGTDNSYRPGIVERNKDQLRRIFETKWYIVYAVESEADDELAPLLDAYGAKWPPLAGRD